MFDARCVAASVLDPSVAAKLWRRRGLGVAATLRRTSSRGGADGRGGSERSHVVDVREGGLRAVVAASLFANPHAESCVRVAQTSSVIARFTASIRSSSRL